MLWHIWFTFTCLESLVTAKAQGKSLSLRSEAAKYDMPFFTAFLDDFDTNLEKYTSYMMKNHITLPQAIADYYYHLAPITTDIDLESDIAQTFPFTEFHTFVTIFPWYSSLLKDADLTTLYLPDDFLTTNTANLTTAITSEITSTRISPVTRTSSSNNVRFTTQNNLTVNSDVVTISTKLNKISSNSTSKITSVQTKSTETTVTDPTRNTSDDKNAEQITSSTKSQNDSHGNIICNRKTLIWTLFLCILSAYI